MTEHVLPAASPMRGFGRVRKALPVLGLVGTAISGYLTMSDGRSAVPEAALQPISERVTVPMLAQEATLLHYARAQGIGDALRETGARFTDRIEAHLHSAASIVEAERTGLTAAPIEMAYSNGYAEAQFGGWDPALLGDYLIGVAGTEVGIREIADQATLRWSGQLGLEEGRAVVQSSIALTIAQSPYAPIRVEGLEADPARLEAFSDVSSAIRNLLGALDRVAHIPFTTPDGQIIPENPFAANQPSEPGLEI